MSKYQPLSEHLARRDETEWPASFSELEAVLGFALPKAARTGRAWWTNDPDKSHSRAWATQGWEVGDVDHAAERVVFRRGAASGAALVEAAGLKPLARSADTARPQVESSAVSPTLSPTAPAAASGSVQPKLMREAAEDASARMHATRALGATALVTAGVAVVAGLGAALARTLLRRRA